MAAAFGLLQLMLAALVPANHAYGNLVWYAAVADAMRARRFFAVWTPYPPVFPALLWCLRTLARSAMAFARCGAHATWG